MTRVKLGEVARESKLRDDGRKPLPSVGLEHLDSGDVTLRRWDEGGSNTFTKRFLPGQVLFGRRRAYLQKAAVAPFEGLCSGDIITVEAIPGAIHERLLPFVIQNPSLFDFAVGKSAGSLSPRVKWGKLAEFDFDLPEMAEQQELADILWTAEGVKEHYRSLIKSSDDLVKSQFVEMFGNPLEEKGNYVALGECCSITTGNTPSRKHPEYYGSDIEWIKSDNIFPGASKLGKAKECLSDAGAQVGRIAMPGWLLMVCIAGSPNTIGNVALVDRQVAFNQQINGIDPRNENPLYIQVALEIMKGKLCEGLNSALKCILNKRTLSAIRIPLPPRSRQDEFAEFANEVDKSKFALQKSLDDLDAMAKKLMNEELGLGNV